MLKNNVLNKFLIASFALLFISACTSNDSVQDERIEDKSPEAIYQKAKNALNSEFYNRAIVILSDLETRYPFGPLSRQVQLDLMFAYYKSGKFAEAIPTIDRFIKLNPNHPSLDYVYYMRGVVNMESNENVFQQVFGIEEADKDITASRDAFDDFKKLISLYPNSKYAPNAKTRMVQLLDKLARYEIVIAQYYLKRAAYVAAINRCKYVLEYYQDSNSIKPALEIMIEAYEKLGLDSLKADTEKMLAANS